MMALTQLAQNLFVYHGAVNVGILRDGWRALLIDFGDGGVQDALRELGIARVDAVLFTHHHRDQASGVGPLAAAGTRIGVPVAERAWFADVDRCWNDPAHRWHLYDFRPHHLMLAQSIPVHATYREGDTVGWGSATISVLGTPGHTDGSVSYQVDLAVEGACRYLFCGDVLYDEGQIWELYSLQKGWETRDYHGFLGDRRRLVHSLRKLRSANALALIPSHGKVMRDPARAVDVLCERLAACYERYVAVSALRHYFPGMFTDFQSQATIQDQPDSRDDSGSQVRRPQDQLPVRAGKPYPGFLEHLGTTWIVCSEDGAAFVVDCGDESVVRRIQGMQARGELGAVEWLWITHYHDDHVNAVPQFQETFGCPVVADGSVAQVIENPLAWRLPCISPSAIHAHRRTQSGDSWEWHEFTVTAYHLPGQTLYHGGLLVEGRGCRILFAGDSFTMAGIDDYCPDNRNFLGQGVGFDACLELVRALDPDIILNCHVDVGFDFTDQECRFVRANLAERERSYGDLFPWDHPNYGMDESWVRCYPYEQRVTPGETVHLQVVLTNHSDGEREAVCRPVLPGPWQVQLVPRKMAVPPKTEQSIAFAFTVPRDVQPGRWLVPVEVTYHGRRLGQFREAILVLE